MTQNNLSAHLSWLLNEKPFVPPAAPLPGYDPTTAESFSSSAPASSSAIPNTSPLEPVSAPNNGPGLASARVLQRPQSVAQGEAPRSAVERRVPDGNTVPDMARLRMAPGTGKPVLTLAQSTPSRTPGPSRNTPVRSVGNLGESISKRRLHTLQTSSPRAGTVASTPINVDVDEIDLTGGGSPSPVSSPIRTARGKKRKSEEFERDIHSPKPTRADRARPATVSVDTDVSDFHDAPETLSPIPDEPPPPYSTIVPNLQLIEDDDDDDDEDYGNPDFSLMETDHVMETSEVDVDAASSSSARKRKPFSRVDSEVSAPPRKIGRQQTHDEPTGKVGKQKSRETSPEKPRKQQAPSGSPKKRTNLHNPPETRTRPEPTSPPKRRIPSEILDSEEDEFGSIDDFGSNHLSPPEKPISSPRKGTVERKLHSSNNPTSLPYRSPSKNIDVVSPRRYQVEQKAAPIPFPIEQKTRSSPKRPAATPKATSVQSPCPPPSTSVSKEKMEKITQAVGRFLEAEGCRLPQLLKLSSSNWEKVRSAFYQHVEENGYALPEQRSRMEKARAKKEALEKLVPLSIQHAKLATERQVHKSKTEAALNAGIENLADFRKALELRTTHHAMEAEIYSYLEDAGMKMYLNPPASSAEDIVMESTQGTPVKKEKESSTDQDVNYVPQTQYVKQAQPPKRALWDRGDAIQFAEGSAARHQALQENRSDAHVFGETKRTLDFGGQDNTSRVVDTPRRQQFAIELSEDDEAAGVPSDLDQFEDDENLFMSNMETHPYAKDEEENFFDDSDDDAMLEGLRNTEGAGFNWKGEKVHPQDQYETRQVFRETSVNAIRQRKHDSSPRKSQSNHFEMSYPWSSEVRSSLVQQFGLRGFRPCQLDAVNTTLAGEHCFVLMPTGGGKSLCYQLPSVIRSGKTRGVTLVVSPLLSLMEDQVDACRNRFSMKASVINGQSTASEKSDIMNWLREADPQDSLQLLYVTPEMLSKNQRMVNIFRDLHRRRLLARVVIDEAHCVSQWGHDFRPDYKALGEVLSQFPGVPIMALTATATDLVRTDVMTNLGIRGCKQLSQSFNRPNLTYEVLPKGKNVVGTIADLIKSKYPRKSGIVYCLARKTCEKVAEKLTELGVKAYHYHAGLEAAERSEVQKKWQNNKYHVIVATIAFGMGIDKADVRFVVHHSLPKSLEGYYQETGRAGRDGKRSGCYLYYLYGDTKTLKKIIQDGDGSKEQKQRQYDMLRNVIQFCENKSDCRRAQILDYFSEKFAAENCNKTCDNCQSNAVFEEQDLTAYAAAAVQLVEQVQDENVTLLQCVDGFRGAKGSKLNGRGLKGFGFGASLERGDVERLFHKMVQDGALWEKTKTNKMKFTTSYIKVGHKADDYAKNRRTLSMQVRISPQKKKAKATKTKAARTEYPSTNISSPIRAPAKRSIQQYAYDDGDDDDDDFEDIHQVRGKSRSTTRKNYKDTGVVNVDDDDDNYRPEVVPASRPRTKKAPALKGKQALGAPITTDKRVEGLTETQKTILQGFVTSAKSISQKICIDTTLKKQPFSDTVIREMGIELPSNVQELCQIPGVDPAMAKLYGKRFFPMIYNTRRAYEPTVPKRRYCESEDLLDDDDEDAEVRDPNHENVYVMISSDEEQEEAADSEDYGSDVQYEDDDEPEVSHHFSRTERDPRVEEYNKTASQPNAQRKDAPSSRRVSPVAKTGSRSTAWKKSSKTSRRSSGNGSKNYSGVKKNFSKKSTGRKASGSFSASTKKSSAGRGGGTGGGRGNGWSSIMAMPT